MITWEQFVENEMLYKLNDVWKFRTELLTKLRADGWKIEFNDNKTCVSPPNS